jgi:hypothetical protein
MLQEDQVTAPRAIKVSDAEFELSCVNNQQFLHQQEVACFVFSSAPLNLAFQLQPIQFLFFQAAAGNIFHFKATKGKLCVLIYVKICVY